MIYFDKQLVPRAFIQKASPHKTAPELAFTDKKYFVKSYRLCIDFKDNIFQLVDFVLFFFLFIAHINL
jgi:hypothetical protein